MYPPAEPMDLGLLAPNGARLRPDSPNAVYDHEHVNVHIHERADRDDFSGQ
jgi:hypothetical protein